MRCSGKIKGSGRNGSISLKDDIPGTPTSSFNSTAKAVFVSSVVASWAVALIEVDDDMEHELTELLTQALDPLGERVTANSAKMHLSRAILVINADYESELILLINSRGTYVL